MFSKISELLNNPTLRSITRDSLLSMDPEHAHRATIMALQTGLGPVRKSPDPKELNTTLAGLELKNPVGMAAGFDKNAQVHKALGNMGFGLVEVGTLTPRPQKGNPKPRLFRLPAQHGVINRMGFNNEGHGAALERLERNRSNAFVGVNVGANRDSEDFVADYVTGVETFSPVADYLAINISSPNTPGLRGLQSEEVLRRLLGETLGARARQKIRVPVFLKISPDLDEEEMDVIAAEIAPGDLDGLIISNTTISRKGVEHARNATEKGGLSGTPLFELSTIRLAQMRQRVGPDLAIIGVGGVHSSDTALAKFEAGADAIQLYTGLVYGGLELLEQIKTGLAREVRRRGVQNIAQITGTKVNEWAQRTL